MPLFYKLIKPMFSGGKLSQSQVDGINLRIATFKKSNWPIAWAAYGFATIFHETAQRMQPVREGLDVSEDYRRRNFRYYPYYGRGDVQLTWKFNYQWADDLLGLNGEMVKNPDLALVPEYSIKIMITGMEGGHYTGVSLPKALPHEIATYAQLFFARKIINGTDRAAIIANYAILFQAALKQAGYANG